MAVAWNKELPIDLQIASLGIKYLFSLKLLFIFLFISKKIVQKNTNRFR